MVVIFREYRFFTIVEKYLGTVFAEDFECSFYLFGWSVCPTARRMRISTMSYG